MERTKSSVCCQRRNSEFRRGSLLYWCPLDQIIVVPLDIITKHKALLQKLEGTRQQSYLKLIDKSGTSNHKKRLPLPQLTHVSYTGLQKMELESAQEAFVGLLGQIEMSSKLKFLEWVCREYNPVTSATDGGGGGGVIEEEPDLFDRIAEELRGVVPPTAVMPEEQQIFHPSSLKEGMNASNTLHVDSFLYPSEEDVDQLCERLEVSRHYCLQCGSWKTSPLNFISHSFSKEQVKCIFENLVPDLSGKTVVDIGSRLGPALYGAYAYSRASKIIGIEMNQQLCELQRQVISRYNLGSRVEIICSDMQLQAATLESADLVILHNVFEFFCSLEQQASHWEFLFRTLRKRGSLIITVPSIQESCSQLTFKSPLNLNEWATEVNTGLVSDDEDLASIHLYCVL